MSTESLDGTDATIPLDAGFQVSAPGLLGTVTFRPAPAAGTSRDAGGPPPLARAFKQLGVIELGELEIVVTDLTPAGTGTGRGTAGDEVAIDVPVAPTDEPLLLVEDENGGLRWMFPAPAAPSTDTTRSAGATRTFFVPRDMLIGDTGRTGTTRGAIDGIGRRILRFISAKFGGPLVGVAIQKLASAWEESNRPHRVCPLDAAGLATDDPAPLPELDSAGWQRIAGGRALLLVHGTFSTLRGGFNSLGVATAGGVPTLTTWAAHYDGRVFGFDHPSLSVDPDLNARRFVEAIPAGIRLDIDIVSHSRGGLVARALHVALAAAGHTVGRVVFVGTPNGGTPLASKEHMVGLLDRLTTALSFIPGGVVTSVLEAVLVAVKVAGGGAVDSLPGLRAMLPDGEYLHSLADGALPDEYYAIAADFRPHGPFLVFAESAVISGVSRAVFGVANDLVVPTDSPSVPLALPAARTYVLPRESGVQHVTYFGNALAVGKIAEFLGIV